MFKIRRSRDRLIFNIGIPIAGKDGLNIATGPRLIDVVQLNLQHIMKMIGDMFRCNRGVLPCMFQHMCRWNMKVIIMALYIANLLFILSDIPLLSKSCVYPTI